MDTVGVGSSHGQIYQAVQGGGTVSSRARADTARGPPQLSPEQRRQVAELQQIDRAVRAHEQAHIAAGRDVITSSANFTYTYGPDGKRYAVGGEVGIDTSPERRPQDNIEKGQRIQAAALAPVDPSPQDYRVAAVGSQLEARGRSDLARQQGEQAGDGERLADRVRQAYGNPAPPPALVDLMA